MRRFLLHCDDVSWGLYEFPIHVVDVSPNPYGGDSPPSLGTYRSAREAEGGIRVYGRVHALAKDGRVANPKAEVSSWFRVGRTAAPSILFEALPGFWLNRFRFVGPAHAIGTAVTPTFDPTTFHQRRLPQRERLIHHAVSLKQKAWGLRYHRGNLLAALEEAVRGSATLHTLTVASAEYSAVADGLYAMLEELAAVLCLLNTIRGAQQTPMSFHKLYKAADDQDVELRTALNAASTWYEQFRVERANSAHAFGTVVGLSDADSDLVLFQHADKRLYQGSGCEPVSSRKASAHVNALLKGSDELIARLSAYILSKFHPWDTVQFRHSAPDAPRDHQLTTTWTRDIVFSTEPALQSATWMLLNDQGQIEMVTDDRGGVVRASDLSETFER
jgi:hypothetical protein